MARLPEWCGSETVTWAVAHARSSRPQAIRAQTSPGLMSMRRPLGKPAAGFRIVKHPVFGPDLPLVVSAHRDSTGTYAALRHDHQHGSLVRLRRGAYAPAAALSGLSTQDRYAMDIAAAISLRLDPVLAGLSAAVWFGLPLVGTMPHTVYLLSSSTSGRRRNGVVEVPRSGHETVLEFDGFRTTSLADTLIEVCRTAPYITALVMLDAALHVDRFGMVPPMISFDELMAAHHERMPYRGSATARGVLAAATTSAESPFESVSRVTVEELGFPEPELQIPIRLKSGDTVYSDFGWPDWRVVGEADGWGKYVDPRYPSTLSLEDRVKAEKRRDNAIRRVQWTPAHWEWADAWKRDPLRAILLDAGLPIVRRPRTLR
ncbi:hypothetical protein ACX9R5_15980 [Rathayibacter sp. CAU 1779]